MKHDIFEKHSMVLLIGILIVRPWGLYGTKEELNRV